MPGMKRDCGGAAAILGAFRLAVLGGFKQNLHAVFCLAENSVGPLATRPDDIHTLYSGRTVEINNTDAEGRLVLADGVVYAHKDLKADIILDMATLTGGQVVSIVWICSFEHCYFSFGPCRVLLLASITLPSCRIRNFGRKLWWLLENLRVTWLFQFHSVRNFTFRNSLLLWLTWRIRSP